MSFGITIKPVGGSRGVVVAVRREVVGIVRLGRLGLEGAGRRTEDEVEAALLKRNLGPVVVPAGGAEEVDRVLNRGRRLERNRGKAHFLHAALDLLLLRALGIVADLRLHRLRRRFVETRGVHGVDRPPGLVDVGDHAVTASLALLLADRLALALDRIADADRVLVVRILDEDDLALLERLLHVAHGKVLAAAAEVAANLVAVGLEVLV